MTRYRSAPALLSLPSDLARPNAYQVFGLRVGESDPQTVSNAIRSTIQRLNELKSDADSEAWRQAAKWVKAAREELLAVVSKPKVVDPLAGLLPGQPKSSPTATSPVVAAAVVAAQGAPVQARPSDRPGTSQPAASAGQLSRGGQIVSPPPPSPPPAPVPPSTTRPTSPDRMADVLPTPTPTPQTESWPSPGGPAESLPPRGSAETVAAEIGSAPASAGQWDRPAVVIEEPARASGRQPAKRRGAGFPWLNAVLVLFAFACLLAVGGLVYVMSKNPQGLVISLQTGGAPGDAASPEPVRTGVAASGGSVRGVPEPRRGDTSGRAGGGSAAGRGTQMAEADRWVESLAGDSAQAGMPAGAAAADGMPAPATMPMATTEDMAAMADQPGDSDAEPMVATEGAGTDENTSSGMTPEQDAGAAALAAARLALRQADWQGMVPAAAAAAAAAVTPEQKLSASRLEELAELAEYYHGGIEAGLDKLKAGESFALTDQLQVVVVEISPERLVVRFSGQNKEYPRQELPLVLAHKIVRFALPTESPVVPIAAAVYEAIAPVSTTLYREKAIRTLEGMTEEVEGVRPSELATELSEVIASSAGSE